MRCGDYVVFLCEKSLCLSLPLSSAQNRPVVFFTNHAALWSAEWAPCCCSEWDICVLDDLWCDSEYSGKLLEWAVCVFYSPLLSLLSVFFHLICLVFLVYFPLLLLVFFFRSLHLYFFCLVFLLKSFFVLLLTLAQRILLLSCPSCPVMCLLPWVKG